VIVFLGMLRGLKFTKPRGAFFGCFSGLSWGNNGVGERKELSVWFVIWLLAWTLSFLLPSKPSLMIFFAAVFRLAGYIGLLTNVEDA